MLNLKAGEVVEIRTEEEIQATLDSNGACEGIPFMPEMRDFCGKSYRVYKRADKICVEGSYVSKLKNTVMLDEVRCDGADHDGCKRMCLIFWKEAWLKRAQAGAPPESPPNWLSVPEVKVGPISAEKVYYCQSTALPKAVEHLSGWDMGQYVRDVTSGSFTLWQVTKAVFISLFNAILRRAGGGEFGDAAGKEIKTPAISLHLQQGDIVQVKTRKEIEATIDVEGKNRGLRIDYEMLRHAGKQFRVLRRVDRIILETNGKMRPIQNTVLLNNAACEGLCRRACARGSHPMWREAWLKRVAKSEDHENKRISTQITSEKEG